MQFYAQERVQARGFLGRLILHLEKEGFLTDHLTVSPPSPLPYPLPFLHHLYPLYDLLFGRRHLSQDATDDKSDSYFGVCRLGDGYLHRRLDLKVTAPSHIPSTPRHPTSSLFPAICCLSHKRIFLFVQKTFDAAEDNAFSPPFPRPPPLFSPQGVLPPAISLCRPLLHWLRPFQQVHALLGHQAQGGKERRVRRREGLRVGARAKGDTLTYLTMTTVEPDR